MCAFLILLALLKDPNDMNEPQSRHEHSTSKPKTSTSQHTKKNKKHRVIIADTTRFRKPSHTQTQQYASHDAVLILNDETQFQELLTLLAQQGVHSYKAIPRLRAIALPRDNELLAMLRKRFPNITFESDGTVQKPNDPSPKATTAASPFFNQLLPWLGINQQTTDRGKGVTIAILDQPLSSSFSTANATITQLDAYNFAQYGSGDGHGNAIASLIVGNAQHFQGIAPDAAILSIPVLDNAGNGTIFTLAAAIVTAADQGAHIISLSLGSETNSQVLQNAVDYATSVGAIVVASAGNNGSNTPFYPAACDKVIAVAACDAASNATTFSNYGDYVDIAAPGLALEADFGDDKQTTEYFTGTSAATPCVSAVIALLMAENPTLTPADAAKIVLEKANDAGAPNADNQFGNGILNYETATNWSNDAYTDAAIGGHFLDLDNASESSTPLIISAQNTGNTTLPDMTLTYSVNGTPTTQTFNDVPPGTTVSVTVHVPNDQRDTIVVSSLVTTSQPEASTDNNRKSSSITVVMPQ